MGLLLLKGLLFKLKAYGIEGDKRSSWECYLSNREQTVVLNGQTSDWKKIDSNLPQGSVLGPLLFLIYIYMYVCMYVNDLPDGITSRCKIFADDTSPFQKLLIHVILKML